MQTLQFAAGGVLALVSIFIFIFSQFTQKHATTEETKIKTMQLYNNIDRIWKDLESEGYERHSDTRIDPSVMSKYDSYNYGGVAGAVAAATALNLTSTSIVLDVGSGLGGPARCIADYSGATVKGVELQPDLTRLANELSERCGLSSLVSIVNGNVLDESLAIAEPESFDAAVSWLVILHIPLSDRAALFTRIFSLLKPGGRLWIEDYFWRGPEPFSAEERRLLSDNVFVPAGALPSREEYEATLIGAGFVVRFNDVTDEWTTFTEQRLKAFDASRERHVRVYNQATFDSLRLFYSSVTQCFAGGRLGGVKLLITKPTDADADDANDADDAADAADAEEL